MYTTRIKIERKKQKEKENFSLVKISQLISQFYDKGLCLLLRLDASNDISMSVDFKTNLL